MMTTREIPFTQYLLPGGRRREVGIERPAEIADKAQALIDAGYRFEAEVLTTGHVSLTIVGHDPADDGEEGDLAIRVVPNGPAVPGAVDDMIANFTPPAALTPHTKRQGR